MRFEALLDQFFIIKHFGLYHGPGGGFGLALALEWSNLQFLNALQMKFLLLCDLEVQKARKMAFSMSAVHVTDNRGSRLAKTGVFGTCDTNSFE